MRLSKQVRTDRAEHLALAVYDAVLSEHSATWSARIASTRVMTELAEHGVELAGVRDGVRQLQVGQEQALRQGDEALLEARLHLLPSTLHEVIRRAWAEDRTRTWLLVEPLTHPSMQPLDVVMEWTESRPSWLDEAGPKTTLAAAELTLAYEANDLGRDLLLLAARRGIAGRQVVIGRVAATYLTHNHAKVREVLALVGTPAESPSPFVRAIEQMSREDWEGVRSTLDTWAPADDDQPDNFRRWLIADSALFMSAPTNSPIGPLLVRSIGPTAALLDAHWRSDIAIAQASRLVKIVGLGQSGRPMFDLQEARRLALEARDARRAWRGETATAVAAACEAAFFAGDVEAVVELGTVGGEATPREAASPDVLAKVAVALAARGKDVTQLDLSGLDAYDRERVLAHSAENRGADSEPHWRAAVAAAAGDESKRAVALAGLAGTGTRDMPDMTYLEQQHPATFAQILAIGELARGEHEQVVERFRGRAGDDIQAATLLAQAYDSAGDTQAAAGIFQRAGARFNDPDFLFNAAMLMYRSGRAPEAQKVVLQLLASESNGWPGRARALHFAAQLAAEADDLPAATGFLVSCLGLDPGRDYRRWDLIRLHLARADTGSAWRVFHEHPTPLAAHDLRQGLAWLTLYREEGSAEELARGAVDLVRRFPNEEALAAKAVASVLLPGPRGGAAIDGDLLADVQAMVAEYLRKWPEGAIRSVSVDVDDPAVLLQQIQDMTRTDPGTAAFRRLTEGQVARGEMPLGLLAAANGKAYCEVLLMRGLGVLPAVAPDSGEWVLSVEEAKAALGGSCIADASALCAASALDQKDRDSLFRAFAACELVDETLMDARNGRDSLSSGSTMSIAYDEAAERSVVHEISEAEAKRLADSAVALLELVLSMPRRRSLMPDDARVGELGGKFSPWLPTLHTAVALGQPLWSDDAALRVLARSMGAKAFSTAALIQGMTSVASLAVERESELQVQLARGYVTVPLDEKLLQSLGDQESWRPLGAAALLGDAVLWTADRQRAFKLLDLAIPHILAESPESLVGWAYRCARGVAYAYPSVLEAAEVAGAVLALMLRRTGVEPVSVPSLMAAMRAGLSSGALDPQCAADPLFNGAVLLRAAAVANGEGGGAEWCARVFSELDADDKGIVEVAFE